MKLQTFSWLALATALIGTSLLMQGGEATAQKAVPEPLQLAAKPAGCADLLNHSFKTLDGKDRSLCDFKGQVLLVVNTASRCGHTPQYESLQKLYTRYQKQGFSVLGFPANHFGKQEPGSDAEIKKFCESEYKISFPMFSKSEILKGHPLYAELIERTGKKPVWNFHKYLIDRNTQQVISFDSSTRPDDPRLIQALEKMLAAKAAS